MKEFGNIFVRGAFGEREIYPFGAAYSHVYVHNGIDTVSFSFERVNPDDIIVFDGFALGENAVSEEKPLAVGKNVFLAEVYCADGTSALAELNVIRAYPTPAWEPLLEHAPWCERDSAGEVVFQNRLWMLGGYTPSPSNDVWSSEDGVNWHRHADCPTTAGIDIPITYCYRDKMYVTDLDNTLWATADGETWEAVCTNPPWKKQAKHIAGTVFRDKLWVISAGNGNRGVWSSADGGYTWETETTDLPFSHRSLDANVLAYNGKLWVLGGGATIVYRTTPVERQVYLPFVAYNDVWCSEDGVNWECATDHAPWRSRIWPSVFIYKNRMWIVSGYRGEMMHRNLGDMWYSVDGKTWREYKPHTSDWHGDETYCFRELPILIPAPKWIDRHESSMLVKDDTVYLMAGMIWPLTNEVWKFKIDGFMFVSQPIFEGFVDILYVYDAFADFSDSCLDAKYRIVSAPECFAIHETTGRLTGTPKCAGKYEIVLEAFTDAGETARQSYVLDIMDQANRL